MEHLEQKLALKASLVQAGRDLSQKHTTANKERTFLSKKESEYSVIPDTHVPDRNLNDV